MTVLLWTVRLIEIRWNTRGRRPDLLSAGIHCNTGKIDQQWWPLDSERMSLSATVGASAVGASECTTRMCERYKITASAVGVTNANLPWAATCSLLLIG